MFCAIEIQRPCAGWNENAQHIDIEIGMNVWEQWTRYRKDDAMLSWNNKTANAEGIEATKQ